MESKSTTEASQRLVLNRDNCNSIFRIPSHLVKSHGEKLPSKVSLRVDNSGKKWKVSIEKFKDHYFFTDGWKEFAEQVDLKSLDFLKFKYGKNKKHRSGDVKATSSIMNADTGEGSGNVKATSSVLNEDTGEGSGNVNGTTSILIENKGEGSGNVKATSSVPNEDTGEGSGNVDRMTSILNENKGEGCGEETTVSFSKEMKYHHRYRVDIPKGFALSTRIQNDMKIRLKDGEGREWPIRLKKRGGQEVLSMCGGWRDFVIVNKVMLGSTISFTWLSKDMFQAQIVDVGTDKQPLCNTANRMDKRL